MSITTACVSTPGLVVAGPAYATRELGATTAGTAPTAGSVTPIRTPKPGVVEDAAAAAAAGIHQIGSIENDGGASTPTAGIGCSTSAAPKAASTQTAAAAANQDSQNLKRSYAQVPGDRSPIAEEQRVGDIAAATTCTRKCHEEGSDADRDDEAVGQAAGIRECDCRLRADGTGERGTEASQGKSKPDVSRK